MAEKSSRYHVEKERVTIENLTIGDHIFYEHTYYSSIFPADHHAIVVSVFKDENKYEIIHYSELKETKKCECNPNCDQRDGFIVNQKLMVFDASRPVYRLNYERKFLSREVVKRANKRLHEREFSYLSNNCECFANWCTLDASTSKQTHWPSLSCSPPSSNESDTDDDSMTTNANNWSWSAQDKSPHVLLSPDGATAMFYTNSRLESEGTSAVRGSAGFLSGEHYWEVVVLEPLIGTSTMIGVGTKAAQLLAGNHAFVNLIGRDEDSWGLSYKGHLWHGNVCRKAYCKPFYARGTVIGCHLDLYEGTLSFYKDGEWLGVAFRGLNLLNEPVYPMVSSTSAEAELMLGARRSRLFSLQQLTLLRIARSCATSADLNCLPLPSSLLREIRSLTSSDHLIEDLPS